MIVADTGAVVALIDADDRHHASLREVFEADAQHVDHRRELNVVLVLLDLDRSLR